MLFARLREDVACILERDPAARTAWEVLTCYPGLHALTFHRGAHWCWTHGLKWLGRWISHWSRFFTGIEIHPGAQIGHRVFIDHGMGVVIGETSVVGDRCLLYQGVTLGGTGKQHGKRHPTLMDNVVVGAGAKVLGNIAVGYCSRIAAGSVVLSDVPHNTTVAGVPARVIGEAGCSQPSITMDQLISGEI